MNPNDTHREQLSALLDGALDTDQSRFLLRRLQHDGELAGSLSRWQLAGDVLRGQIEAPAPVGFAQAVAARIADEPLPLVEGEGINVPVRAVSTGDVVARAAVARGARWRWFGGGAMAASLAIAGVLALRPDTGPVASTNYAITEAASPVGPSSANAPSGDSAVPATTNAVAAAPVANPSQPSPATISASVSAAASNNVARAPVRVARATAMPAPTRASSARDRDAEPAAPTDSAARLAQTQPDAQANPFQPPTAKPWPRAVLPGAGSGTFNASFHSDTSYYPFTPQSVEPVNPE